MPPEPILSNAVQSVPTPVEMISRPFLPSLDLVDGSPQEIAALQTLDKRQIINTKISDATHFQVGLSSLHQHVEVARRLAPLVRSLPRAIRGRILQPDRSPAARLSVQPELAGSVIGRGVLTDDLGLFTLPIPAVPEAGKAQILSSGLKLRVTGLDASVEVTVHIPPAGSSAVGQLVLSKALEPLPQSVVGALIDLVDDLPAVIAPSNGQSKVLGKVQIGQGGCNIVFAQDSHLQRFPYSILIRLVEPRTTTVNQVFLPSGPFYDKKDGNFDYVLPVWDPAKVSALKLTETRFIERVPIDKPISVDGFRDQLIGLNGRTITAERDVPMAGTLGLGYVLNLAQVWTFDGLTLGNLVYSLPLAPGEQQRIAVTEQVSTSSLSERELLDVSEQQNSSLFNDSSTRAVFDSALQEKVNTNSSYANDARTSSWGLAGGIGALLGPVVLGLGASGGSGSASDVGSTETALDSVKNYTSDAAESMHQSVEQQAAARQSAQHTSIQLATETDTSTTTTKVITNHNRAHALTIQYWEVLRKFMASTEIEGVNLVCFIPLDLVRFLPPGQVLDLANVSGVNTRAELLQRYALLHRHADAIQPWLPGRHREGLSLLEQFVANPRATVNLSSPASDVMTFSLKGTFLPYERVSIYIVVRGGRQIGPANLDSSLTAIPAQSFGTKTEFIAELKRRRQDTAGETSLTGSLALPEETDKTEIIGFSIQRAFQTIEYQLDPTKNPTYQLLKSLDNLPGTQINLSAFEIALALQPEELEQTLGGPLVHDLVVKINTSANLASDGLSSRAELPPGPLPIAAVEIDPTLGFRDLMKMERTLHHVVRNTMTYSKAVWMSLTPEERVVMLEGYTIGLPQKGLPADALSDPSQHVPLLNCVANQVIGYYGNCMVMPFSIPAALSTKLSGDQGGDGESRPPLTTGAVQEALTEFHKQAFSPPISEFTLPTRGVLGEAVLGHCPSAEKIDITRFWNWKDSESENDKADPIPSITTTPLTLTAPNALTPSTLGNLPSIINNVGTQGGTPATSTATSGSLVSTLADKAPTFSDSTPASGSQDAAGSLAQNTLADANGARTEAVTAANGIVTTAIGAVKDIFSSAQSKKDADTKAAQDKAAADAKAAQDKQDAAVKDLQTNASAYLAAAGAKPDVGQATAFAKSLITSLVGSDGLPASSAAKLFTSYDKQEGNPPTRTAASTAWLTALGLL